MTPRCFSFQITHTLLVVGFAACTTPNPNYHHRDADAVSCTANLPLRCDGTTLVHCDAEGAAEVSELCPLGCLADSLRCAQVAPSNGLTRFLDVASGQPDLNLSGSATIDTDTGEVSVGGAKVAAYSEVVTQTGGPAIRVFAVRSCTTNDVKVTGMNAVAVVSSGDVNIGGVFAASAAVAAGAAGAFNEERCMGRRPNLGGSIGVSGGSGGGGFGLPGGEGGAARNSNGFQGGASGGATTGDASLVPLRGGCDGGAAPFATANFPGRGGGAIQIVSQTQIAVSGRVSANGTGAKGGGGSGGGILLEAPIVEVSGGVVANGGGGGGFIVGKDGGLDSMPAAGGDAGSGGSFEFSTVGQGGNGAAGESAAANGKSNNETSAANTVGGHGGGGVGRIRVNTAPGGQRGKGFYSPAPSQGALGSR